MQKNMDLPYHNRLYVGGRVGKKGRDYIGIMSSPNRKKSPFFPTEGLFVSRLKEQRFRVQGLGFIRFYYRRLSLNPKPLSATGLWF